MHTLTYLWDNYKILFLLLQNTTYCSSLLSSFRAFSEKNPLITPMIIVNLYCSYGWQLTSFHVNVLTVQKLLWNLQKGDFIMNQTETIDYKHGTTYAITVTALMTAVTCILAPLSIPIGPVPISLTNLAIYISLYLLGWKRGTISYLIYQIGRASCRERV